MDAAARGYRADDRDVARVVALGAQKRGAG